MIDEKTKEGIESIIKVQKSDGNWNYDPYMHGLLNGMLLIESIVLDKKYEPYTAPKKWKYKTWYQKLYWWIYFLFNKPVKEEIN